MARILKQETERLLGNVPEDNVFRCCDGHIMKNLEDLRQAFGSMDDGAYMYHANSEKNDFCNWVRYIIRDEKLASDLSTSHNKSEAAKAVDERIGLLNDQKAKLREV